MILHKKKTKQTKKSAELESVKNLFQKKNTCQTNKKNIPKIYIVCAILFWVTHLPAIPAKVNMEAWSHINTRALAKKNKTIKLFLFV